MPTVLRFRGLRVVIYPNDHRPAHVHVIGRGSEAVFRLGCWEGTVEIRENYGFPPREIHRIADRLEEQLTALCDAWEKIHGNI